LELLAHLVDKSLVLVEESGEGEVRYRLLETMRQYGRDRLGEAGEAASVGDRHLACCCALAERAAPQLRRAEQAWWLERLEQEPDTLRAALVWSQAQARTRAAGLRLATALEGFWEYRAHYREGRRWLEQALAGAEAGEGAPALRAAALNGLARLASYLS